MPRSDKPISGGSLTDPITSARSRSWSSHASPEDADQFEPDGVSLVDPLTQEPVEAVVDLVDPVAPVVDHVDPVMPVVAKRRPVPESPRLVRIPVYEWSTVRSIEGRTYTRIDERHEVVDDS